MDNRLTACLLAFALGFGALMAGCGGEDEPDPKAEYIKKADGLCAIGTFQIGTEARKRYGSAQPPAKEQKLFAQEVVVPVLRTQVLAKLRALTPPPGDAQNINAIWAALERGIDKLKANPGLFATENAGGAFDEANRLAQAYGFRQCGSG